MCTCGTGCGTGWSFQDCLSSFWSSWRLRLQGNLIYIYWIDLRGARTFSKGCTITNIFITGITQQPDNCMWHKARGCLVNKQCSILRQVKDPTHGNWEYLDVDNLFISSLRLLLEAAHIRWSSFRASSIEANVQQLWVIWVIKLHYLPTLIHRNNCKKK